MHPQTCNSESSAAAPQSCRSNTDISLEHKWAQIQPSHTIKLKAQASPATSLVYSWTSDRVQSIDGFRLAVPFSIECPWLNDDILCSVLRKRLAELQNLSHIDLLCLIVLFFFLVLPSPANLITICEAWTALALVWWDYTSINTTADMEDQCVVT